MPLAAPRWPPGRAHARADGCDFSASVAMQVAALL